MTDTNNTTAMPQPLTTDDELVEQEAQKWVAQLVKGFRQNNLKERLEARVKELLLENGIPEKTEQDHIDALAQTHFDRMVGDHRNALALAQAEKRFAERSNVN